MSHPPNGSAFTIYGWAVCLWALIIAFQYGYHISVLNQIQSTLTCTTISPTNAIVPSMANCIPMSDLAFSFVTAIFTVGGLAGSLVANLVMDSWGRRGTHRLCAIFIGVGTAIMGLSSSLSFLMLGRFFTGVGSGLGLCVGPIFLAEIAPSSISGSVGVLTQLSIVLGIMVTQGVGLGLSSPALWRYVFLVSFCLSALQILLTSAVVESPAFLHSKRRFEEHKSAARRLWGNTIPSTPSEEPLLDDSDDVSLERSRQESLTIPQAFRRKELRRPLIIVCIAMLAQQISGINAVLYYSNDILSKSLPEFGPYVSVGVTVINVIMTFPPIVLIERLGRKPLLLLSAVGSVVSLVLLGYGLDAGDSTLPSVGIITFVMSFAIGLGPVPFVMIPEVSPPHAAAALSSVALSLNWIANFIVGLAFLPVRNLLAGGDRYKEGRVFYVFVAMLAASMFSLLKVYRG